MKQLLKKTDSNTVTNKINAFVGGLIVVSQKYEKKISQFTDESCTKYFTNKSTILYILVQYWAVKNIFV